MLMAYIYSFANLKDTIRINKKKHLLIGMILGFSTSFHVLLIKEYTQSKSLILKDIAIYITINCDVFSIYLRL
ncbi:MAG: hypothetical protein ACJAX4_004455 [Clostridium sp.]|jgi:hypothetical protein